MKTLTLILALTLTANAQSLVTADGVEWRYIGDAENKFTEQKFVFYARKLKSAVKSEAALAVKVECAGDSHVFESKYNCKTGEIWLDDGQWKKPPAGSMGVQLLKFACHK